MLHLLDGAGSAAEGLTITPLGPNGETGHGGDLAR
jgi:hypothetical protein